MISQENLDVLIAGLEECKAKGISDPWLLSDGTTIEPLDVLKELDELRQQKYEAEDTSTL